MNDPLFIMLIAVVNWGVGFAIGKLHERVEWNNLIRQGKLLKPQTVKVRKG